MSERTILRKFIVLLLVIYLIVMAGLWMSKRNHLHQHEEEAITVTVSVWSDASKVKLDQFTERLKQIYPDVLLQMEKPTYSHLHDLLKQKSPPDLLYVDKKDNLEKLKADFPNWFERVLSIAPTSVPAALYYNKDIFDRFGVSYPVAGSTWEELAPLIERLTRYEEGIQYQGLAADMSFLYSHLSPEEPLPQQMSDPNYANIEMNWKQWVLKVKELFALSVSENMALTMFREQDFIREHTIAMWAGPDMSATFAGYEGQLMDWDLIPYPVFADSTPPIHHVKDDHNEEYAAPFLDKEDMNTALRIVHERLEKHFQAK